MNEKAMDTKIFKILAYLPFLWLIGFFCPYRNDKDIRFHVGQGMVLNIFMIVVSAIIELLVIVFIKNIFSVEQIIFGVKTGIYILTPAGNYIILGLWLLDLGIYLYFAIFGILCVNNKKEDKLPYIGEYALIR